MSELTFDAAWATIKEVLQAEDNPATTRGTYGFWWRVLRRFLESEQRGALGDDGALLLPTNPATLLTFEAWMRQPARQGGGPRYAPGSVAAGVGAVKGCYSRLRRAGVLEGDPALALRSHRRDRRREDRRLYTGSEIKNLLSWSEQRPEFLRLTLSLTLGALAGLRFEEMRLLTWGDAGDGSGKLRVYGKGGKTRWVPISPALGGYLQRLRSHTPDVEPTSYVFQGARLGTPLSSAVIRNLQSGAKGVIPDFSYHSLRFTYAVSLRQRGVPIEQVSRLLGHSDYETTMRYLGAFASESSHAASALEEIEEKVIPQIETTVGPTREALPEASSTVLASVHPEEQTGTAEPTSQPDRRAEQSDQVAYLRHEVDRLTGIVESLIDLLRSQGQSARPPSPAAEG